MKTGYGKLRILKLLLAAVTCLLFTSCGNRNAGVVPATPGAYGVYGAGCGGASGTVGQLYGFGNLNTYYGGINSITVSLQPSANFNITNIAPQNMLGTGCLSLTDLPGLMTQINGGQVQVLQTAIPINSSGVNAPAAPGLYYPSIAGLSMAMTGAFPFSTQSPFNGYPTGYPSNGMGNVQQATVTVNIGPVSGGGPTAGLANNRVTGQIIISVGPGTFPYTSN
jgi:hypothetical protein